MLKGIFHYFGLVMSLFYLGIGLLFLFTDQLIYIFPNNRMPIGIVFSVYSIFRIVLSIRKYKKAKREETE